MWIVARVDNEPKRITSLYEADTPNGTDVGVVTTFAVKPPAMQYISQLVAQGYALQVYVGITATNDLEDARTAKLAALDAAYAAWQAGTITATDADGKQHPMSVGPGDFANYQALGVEASMAIADGDPAHVITFWDADRADCSGPASKAIKLLRSYAVEYKKGLLAYLTASGQILAAVSRAEIEAVAWVF